MLRCTLRNLLLLLVAIALGATACGSSEPLFDADAVVRGSEPTAEATAAPADSPAVIHEGEEPTEPAVTAPAPTATKEPAAEPTEQPVLVSAQPVATAGASGSLRGLRFDIGVTTATNAKPGALLQGEAVLDDASWLLVEIHLENDGPADPPRFGSEHFTLTSPDGLVLEDPDMFRASGKQQFGVDIEGRDSHDLVLGFKTSEPVADASGWMLTVADDGGIDLPLPLQGSSFERSYPVALPSGATGEFSAERFAGCTEPRLLTTVDAARIDIEAYEGERATKLLRARASERLLVVDLAIENPLIGGGDSSESNCGLVGSYSEFLASVDGRLTEATSTPRPDIASGAISSTRLVFRIAADAQSIVLVGGEGQTELASWNVVLPPAVGDLDAPLTPSGAATDPAQPHRPDVPEGLVEQPVGTGGATASMVAIDFTIGASTATTAEPESVVAGDPTIDKDGRAWLMVDASIETTDATVNWMIRPNTFVLVDPLGRPWAGQQMFDRTGERIFGLALDGLEAHDVRLAFATPDLLGNSDGWTMQVEYERAIPAVLPLDGESPVVDFPVPLGSGQGEIVPNVDPPGVCRDEASIATEVDAADLAIERRPGESFRETAQRRATIGSRFVILDLSMTLDGTPEDPAFGNCGLTRFWPEYLLRVDGRLLAPFGWGYPNLEPNETEQHTLEWSIPADAREIVLTGGNPRIDIVRWIVRDDGAVLTDLDAAEQEEDERTLITLDETLLFAFGESTVQREAEPVLDRIAGVLTESSEGDVTIVGHTDGIGDNASNQKLSEARAQAVADVLIEAGVDPDRLIITGAGESRPVAPNENDDGSDNPAGRAENRRVEILFTFTG